VKIVFLDIDGVLNSLETAPGGGSGLSAWLDPRNIAVLNRVIEATAAQLVISSSWRTSTPLPELQERLRQAGCIGEVIGVTPVLSAARGVEILSWLQHNPEPDGYVIIDDFFDLQPLSHKHVRTSPLRGLAEADLPAVLAQLEG
jgi:hypothetical protein